MVATRKAFIKGHSLFRSILATGAIIFGFFSLFFAKTPDLWGPTKNANQNALTDFFVPNAAHADVPVLVQCNNNTCVDGDGGGK